MIIKRIDFRNINSFGHKLQTIEFPDVGQLILISGSNGNGKSTIKQVIELSLFARVQGKSGKKLALSKLPNRRNKSLYTSICFENDNGDEIVIKRYIEPTKAEIYVNNEPFTEKYKVMNELEREKFIGFSYEVFKSFISLNINDFKNFISLKLEDKRNLLNKLFNLDELDKYFSIVSDLDKLNNKEIFHYTELISNNNKQIDEYISTISKIGVLNRDERIKEILEIFEVEKPKYSSLIEEKKEIEQKIKQINYDLKGYMNLK